MNDSCITQDKIVINLDIDEMITATLPVIKQSRFDASLDAQTYRQDISEDVSRPELEGQDLYQF